jgi:hypothetical protein
MNNKLLGKSKHKYFTFAKAEIWVHESKKIGDLSSTENQSSYLINNLSIFSSSYQRLLNCNDRKV